MSESIPLPDLDNKPDRDVESDYDHDKARGGSIFRLVRFLSGTAPVPGGRKELLKIEGVTREILDEALKASLMKYISVKTPAATKSFIDKFEISDEILNSPEVQAAIDERFEEMIYHNPKNGKKFSEDYDIPRDRVETICKRVLLKSVSSANWFRFRSLCESFDIQEEIVLEDEYRQVAEETILRCLSFGRDFTLVNEMMEVFKISEQFRKTEEYKNSLRQGLINLSANKNIIRLYESTTDIEFPDDVIFSPDVQDVLKNNYLDSLSITNLGFDEYFEYLEKFKLSDESYDYEPLQNKIKDMFIGLISKGKLYNAFRWLSVFKTSRDFLSTEEAKLAGLEGFEKLVRQNNHTEAQRMKTTFGIENQVVTDVYTKYFKDLLYGEDKFDDILNFHFHFLPEDIFKSDEVIEKIKIKARKVVEEGEYLKFEKFVKVFGLDEGFFNSQEAKDSAIKGVSKLIVNGRVDSALLLKKDFNIKNEEIVDVLKSNFLYLIQTRRLHHVLEVLHKFDLQADVFDSEEYKRSLVRAISRFLSDGQFNSWELAITAVEIFHINNEIILDELKEWGTRELITAILVFNLNGHSLCDFVTKLRNVIEFNPDHEGAVNNQWVSDVIPLLSNLESQGISLLDNQEEIIRSIKEIGPVNNIYIHKLAIAILKNNLNDEEKETLKSIGVKDFTLGNLRVAIDRIQLNLLEGSRVGERASLDNDIDYSVFQTRFLLTSDWNVNMPREKWIEYARNDEYRIPDYLKESEHINFSIEMIKNFSSEDLDTYINHSNEFYEVVIRKRERFLEYTKDSFDDHIYKFMISLTSELNEIDKLLSLKYENQWKDYIAEADSELEKEKRQKLKEKLSNDNIRVGFEKRREKINSIISTLDDLPDDNKEVLKIVSEIKEAKELFDKLLIVDLFETEDLQGFKSSLVDEEYPGGVLYLNQLHEFLTHGLREHYLDKIEDQRLVESIKKSLGLVDTGKGKTSIDVVKEKVDALLKSEIVSTENVSIEMIPVAGVARLTAGNIGNACYTSQINILHQNRELDKVHSFLFAQRDKSGNLSFKGSCLLIETQELNSDETVFVIRANNPRENFIMSMSEKSRQKFVDETILAFKRYAEKYALMTGKNAKTVIIGDKSSESSTNRPSVEKAYGKHMAIEKLVNVPMNQATCFNGYNLSKISLYEV